MSKSKQEMPDGPQIIRQRKAALLAKYYRGDLSEYEKLELEELSRQDPILKEMMHRLDDKELVKKDLDYQEHIDTELQWPAFLEKVRAHAPSGRPVSRIIKWAPAWAAAAVALFFIVRNVLTTYKLPAEKQNVVINTAPPHKGSPGINRATLTLFDGQKIVLDSATEGKVWSKYAITITKTDTATIRYTNPATFHLSASGEENFIGYNTLETPRRGQFSITLPDGTRVWLNNASSLRFPAVFTGSKREVELTGEAFFDVATDAHRPFFVRVPKSQMDIHVLGTSFNVSAYPDDPVVRTTLVSGKVRVTQRDNSTLLKPQQQLIAGKDGAWELRRNITEVSWRENQFNFDSAGLQQVMHQIARQYDKDFEFRGQVREHVYNGLFFRSLSLESVLRSLSGGGKNFHYIIKENKIIISP
jgi:ferric-dicitrate binding protein FerR (iron transport regulator)